MDLILLLFFFSILIFLGLRFLSFKMDFRANKAVTNFFLCIHIFFILLFSSTIILSEKELYYWGYRSGSWIFLAMTLSGVIYFLLRPDSRFLFTWVVFPFMITILSVGLSSLLLYGIMTDYKRDLVYKDKNYRLERTGWFITPCRLPTLFVKEGLLERKLKYNNEFCLSKKDIDSVQISKAGDDSVKVVFYHHSNWQGIPKPIEVMAMKK